MADLWTDEHQGCPARLHDGDGWICAILNENQVSDEVCHETNCAVYFWLEKFVERVRSNYEKIDKVFCASNGKETSVKRP